MVLRIAPYNGRKLPEETDFEEVETRDLSPLGLSFLTLDPPKTIRMMLMLGDDYCPIYVPARVVHRQEGFWADRWQHLIGCEFAS